MELHFCSQCGISIPLTEVQSGAAKAGEGRFVCSEHRSPVLAAAKSAERSNDAAGAKLPEKSAASQAAPELLFCANCQVSIPVSDVEGGRAKREFGSLFCSPCSAADPSERDRRRKAVEDEMADEVSLPKPDDTAETRRCTTCSALVPTGQIAAGRAIVDGTRVVCPNCRHLPAPAPAARPQATSSAGTLVLFGFLLVALGAAGFFGMEYYKAQQKPTTTVAATTPSQLAELRSDVERRLDAVEAAADQRSAELKSSQKDAIDQLHARISGDLLALREDLSETRAKFSAADGEMLQRMAKLEGQVGGLQEMVKSLASRPSGADVTRPTPESTRPPEGPAPDAPVAPPAANQPNPEVTRLIKDLLEGKDEGTRFAAAVELIRRKERSAIPAFAQALVQDTNVMVRRSAASGLGELKAWYAVPVLVQALEDKEAYVAARANYAIQAVTGQDFGVTTEHTARDRRGRAINATKWWEKNKDTPPDGVCLEPVVIIPTK